MIVKIKRGSHNGEPPSSQLIACKPGLMNYLYCVSFVSFDVIDFDQGGRRIAW